MIRFSALLSLSVLALLGCAQPKGAGPQAQCSKEYEQCLLSPGVLGVCNAVECAANQPPPCLVCRSQH